MLVDPQNTDIVYVLTEQGQIYRTTNAGGQWNLFDQGIQSLQMTDLVLDSAHGNAIYAATFDHLYILANSTQSWQMLDTDPIPQIPSLPSKVSLRIDPTLPYRPVPFTESGALIGLPIPTITKLSPDTAPAGTRSFTLTVDGSDFTPVARVRWNGQDRPTTFVSDTRLTAAISATDVLTPSVVPIAVGYRRFSSATSDGASNTLPFMIQPACAVNGLAVASEQCAVSVTPGMPATLVYTSSSSLVTSISVPSGSVTETTVLGYTAVTTATAPAGFGFAGLAFTLDAYRNDSKLAGFVFTQPIVITVHYGDDDIAGLNEKTLTLDYWSGTTWVDAATTCSPSSLYQRELNANRFSVAVCHLTPFGVFGVSERKLFLPFLHR